MALPACSGEGSFIDTRFKARRNRIPSRMLDRSAAHGRPGIRNNNVGRDLRSDGTDNNSGHTM